MWSKERQRTNSSEITPGFLTCFFDRRRHFQAAKRLLFFGGGDMSEDSITPLRWAYQLPWTAFLHDRLPPPGVPALNLRVGSVSHSPFRDITGAAPRRIWLCHNGTRYIFRERNKSLWQEHTWKGFFFHKEGNLKWHPWLSRADTDIWHVHRTRQILLQYLCGAICRLVPFKPLFTQTGRRAFLLPHRPV